MARRQELLGVGEEHDRVLVDGVELAYEDRGAGDPIVCLHAIGHGAGDFARIVERFSGAHRVLALDWPNHGRSGNDSVPTSAVRYADLLEGFLERVGVRNPVILGNSIGGAAAIDVASRCPERVRALVLANPGGLQPIDALTRTVCRAMASLFGAGARGARWFPSVFAAYYRLVLSEPPARERRRRVVEAVDEAAPVLAEAWGSFRQPEADLRRNLASLRCPVLFAWAKKDPFVSYRRCEDAIRSCPTASVEFFRAGHSAFLEAPHEFEVAFDRFLRTLPPWSEGAPSSKPEARPVRVQQSRAASRPEPRG